MTELQPTGEVHEAANVFPMLPEDELAELAEDIKANGLIHEIVLDKDGALVDGRNRLVACRRAGVEPRFTTLDGQDPVSYILSANVNRRNLNKGQRAMAVVKLCVAHNVRQTAVAESIGVDQSRISRANTVLKNAPELAMSVMAGTVTLDAAYAEAKQRKEQRQSREEQAKRDERDLALLRASALDLADLVAEDRMPLREAMAVLREREEVEREQRTRLTRNCWSNLVGLHLCLRSPDPARMTDQWLPGVRGLEGMAGTESLLTAEGLRNLARSLDEFAGAVEERGGRLE